MNTRKIQATSKRVDELMVALRAPSIERNDDHLTDDEFIDYTMRTMTAAELSRVEEHLASCAECSAEVKRLVSTAQAWHGADAAQHLDALRHRLLAPNVVGEFMQVMREQTQKLASLIFGDYWQLLPELTLGEQAQEPPERAPESGREILKLASGPLRDAEVERTLKDQLVINLNRRIPKGSQLKLVTETGEELEFAVVHQLDRQGRAIYDLHGVEETPPFRLVLVEGE